jgi:hypothetical protein
MSDLKKEDYIAKAFSEYPELKDYVFGLMWDIDQNNKFRDLFREGPLAYTRHLMQDLGHHYEVNTGQQRREGKRGQLLVWEIYKLTRLFDGKVFKIGDSTEKGVIKRMVSTNGCLDIHVEDGEFEGVYGLEEFQCHYF